MEGERKEARERGTRGVWGRDSGSTYRGGCSRSSSSTIENSTVAIAEAATTKVAVVLPPLSSDFSPKNLSHRLTPLHTILVSFFSCIDSLVKMRLRAPQSLQFLFCWCLLRPCLYLCPCQSALPHHLPLLLCCPPRYSSASTHPLIFFHSICRGKKGRRDEN